MENTTAGIRVQYRLLVPGITCRLYPDGERYMIDFYNEGRAPKVPKMLTQAMLVPAHVASVPNEERRRPYAMPTDCDEVVISTTIGIIDHSDYLIAIIELIELGNRLPSYRHVHLCCELGPTA